MDFMLELLLELNMHLVDVRAAILLTKFHFTQTSTEQFVLCSVGLNLLAMGFGFSAVVCLCPPLQLLKERNLGGQLLIAATVDGDVCLPRFPEIFVLFVQSVYVSGRFLEIFVLLVQPVYLSVFAAALPRQGLAQAIGFRLLLLVSSFELSCKPCLSPLVDGRYRLRSPGMQAPRCAQEVVHA